MKRFLTRSIAIAVFTLAVANCAFAQTGPGASPEPSNGSVSENKQLTPERLANLLRQDGHQIEVKKVDGGHLVDVIIQRDGWRFVVQFEFTNAGKNMSVICPLGNPAKEFSAAQLLALMKKSFELPVPLHFSYRAADQRLCLEDPCYSTASLTDAGVKSLLDRLMKTARETHSLWDNSRWPLNAPAAGGPQAPPADKVVPAAPQGLAKSTWIGTESLQGYSRLEFRFEADGKVTMIDADGSQSGAYSQQGNTVTLQFYNGTVVYTGTLNGTTLAGTASNGKSSWDFNVSR